MHTHQKITLDINQNASFVYINAKQGDKNTRYVDAIITCDGVQYKPPVGSMAYFRCEKSDGTGCSYPATINTDGSVTAELTNNALSAPGDVVADISIEGMYGEVLSTASFTIRVEEIPLGDNIESSNEYVRLLALTNRANEIVSELENATFRTFQGYIQATTDGENWVDLVEINTLVGSQGPAGKSAYAYAQDGGYTGTEEEFAEKLAQETTGGATPAFYVTVQMNSDGTAYEADKTVDDIGAAYQAGRPIFCNLYGETGYRMTLLLTTWTEPPTYMYSFSGADSVRAATVNITQTGVGVVVKEIPDSGIPIPETAEIGQTIVVKTVDENGKPTAWEAADFHEGGSAKWNLVADITLEEENYLVRQTVGGYEDYLIFVRAIPGVAHTTKSTLTIDAYVGVTAANLDKYVVAEAVWNDGKTAIVTQAHFSHPKDAKWIYGFVARKGDQLADGDTSSGSFSRNNLDGEINRFDIYTDSTKNVFGIGTQVQIFGR